MQKFIEPTNILMIDIETKDTKITAEIIEVAALAVTDRSVTAALHLYTHSSRAVKTGYTASPETLKFHVDSNTRVLENQLRASILGTTISPHTLITELNTLTAWLPRDTIIYCFGLSFDIPILNYTAATEKTELLLPSYRNLRCLRTELATAKSLGFIEKVIPTAHNATDDCANQLDLLYAIFDFYKGLTNGTNN
jgi:DNA polymerase III epsilon subunit-like protein